MEVEIQLGDFVVNRLVELEFLLSLGGEHSWYFSVDGDHVAKPRVVLDFVDFDPLAGVDLEHAGDQVPGPGVDKLWDFVAALWS